MKLFFFFFLLLPINSPILAQEINRPPSPTCGVKLIGNYSSCTTSILKKIIDPEDDFVIPEEQVRPKSITISEGIDSQTQVRTLLMKQTILVTIGEVPELALASSQMDIAEEQETNLLADNFFELSPKYSCTENFLPLVLKSNDQAKLTLSKRGEKQLIVEFDNPGLIQTTICTQI